MSVSDIVPLTNLQKYAKNGLFVNIFTRIKSFKSEIYLKEWIYEEPLIAPTYDISNNTACYIVALKQFGIIQNNTEEITELETAPCPIELFHSNWVEYTGNK